MLLSVMPSILSSACKYTDISVMWYKTYMCCKISEKLFYPPWAYYYLKLISNKMMIAILNFQAALLVLDVSQCLREKAISNKHK